MTIINNSKTDPNKILPMTYLWARQYYLDGVANNWTPQEISMQKDVEQWKSPVVINEHERLLIMRNLGFFSRLVIFRLYQHMICTSTFITNSCSTLNTRSC